MKVELDKVREIVAEHCTSWSDRKVIDNELDKLEAEETKFCKGEICRHFKDAFKREGKPTLISCSKLKEGYSFPLGVNCGDFESKDHPEPKMWLHTYKSNITTEIRQFLNEDKKRSYDFLPLPWQHIKTEPWNE